METEQSQGSLPGKFVPLKLGWRLSASGGLRKYGERLQRVPRIFLLLLRLESLKVQSFGPVGLLLSLLLLTV